MMSPETRLEWREAFGELWRRRLRSGLTLLGLIFGVGAIVAMEGIGEGSQREALRLVESMGLRNVIVERVEDPDREREVRARSLGLSIADMRVARNVIPGVRAVAAEKRIATYAAYSAFGESNAQAVAISPAYLDLTSLKLEQGRLLRDGDDERLAPVALLGHQAARDLFPAGHAVGDSIKVNHVWLRVIGVLADRDLAKDRFEGVQLTTDSNRIFIPLGTGSIRFRIGVLEDELDRFMVALDDPDTLGPASRVLSALLRQRHGGIDDFRIVVPQQLLRQNQATQRIFSVVMGSIAGVSLLVGGIGIMNIMLANILERRREIGLLRALGARRRDIVARFLREAVVVCSAGSLIGLVFGALLAYGIAAFAGWSVAWTPLSVIPSVVLCGLIGILFAVYPARQAASLEPIAALRDE
ncbi:ABC transporter permease [Xanthomonas citri]|uniref:ABC transporter permease n=2 Tax=Xanthomonas citri TaxID=346 RepID=UPI0002DC4F1A|nr:ABC transporter permease [Xanthomonas citri]